MRPLVLLIGISIASFIASAGAPRFDTSLLDGPLVQFISIMAAVSFAAAFFFLQSLDRARDNFIADLELLRKNAEMPPANDALRSRIEQQINNAAVCAKRNALCVVVSAGMCASATIWCHTNFPWVTWPFQAVSKVQVGYFLAYMCVGTTISCTIDLVLVAFDIHQLGRIRPKPSSAPAPMIPGE